jgi:hypothetical protein
MKVRIRLSAHLCVCVCVVVFVLSGSCNNFMTIFVKISYERPAVEITATLYYLTPYHGYTTYTESGLNSKVKNYGESKLHLK